MDKEREERVKRLALDLCMCISDIEILRKAFEEAIEKQGGKSENSNES